ncbi:MAG TPA: FHA domain-containing protein [Casimicrobiaceae bacterium]|jgi:hypothetical protein
MKLKGWMLRKVNRMGSPDSHVEPRVRDALQERGSGGAQSDAREPSMRAFAEQRGVPDNAEYLGPYRPLIGAIREELVHFVTSQLRLHLAIAERDRYVLASIEVECEKSDEHRELLRKFIAEFKPEQIKHYLANEVIAGLRNASSIDLSQFAGLNAMQHDDAASEEDDRYGELLTELSRGSPQSVARPYRVTLLGRWSQLEAPAPASDRGSARPRGAQTPLAAQAFAIEIEDAGGHRRVELPAVVTGRRYAVGKGEDCDVVVEGVYASRRHCEIWLDKGAWWVVDTGSTNGIRVESANGVIAGAHREPRGGARLAPLELATGAWLVLAERTQGEARECPRLALHPVSVSEDAAKRPTGASPSTPVTPIAPPRRRDGELIITARMASGVRTVEIPPGSLPFRVGRSRNQALVIDWAHADVSGRHFEIVALEESGAMMVIHGENGVTIDGKSHGPGARLKWNPGETLVLGGGSALECTLTLSRAA